MVYFYIISYLPLILFISRYNCGHSLEGYIIDGSHKYLLFFWIKQPHHMHEYQDISGLSERGIASAS